MKIVATDLLTDALDAARAIQRIFSIYPYQSMTRILFVCMGNICRSPTALAVVRSLAKRAGLTAEHAFDAAGTHAYHVNEAPDPRTRAVALARGYDMKGLRARCLTDLDFGRFDRILAMDRRNLQFLMRACPPEHCSKLGLFMEYAEGLGLDEVPDPYYGGVEGFERVLDLCEHAGRGLVETLLRQASERGTDQA